MRFRDQRKLQMSDTHKGLAYDPRMSRRRNRKLRQKGVELCVPSK